MPKKTDYLATDAQVASLARDYVQSATGAENARGTFLRILVAHSLREFSRSQMKRHTQAEQLACVETAHAHLYQVVLEAVTTPEIQADAEVDVDERRRRTLERNRRTTFARTSKSALAGYVKAGGKLASLDPSTVTRDTLTQFVRSAREGPASAPERFDAAKTRLEKALRDLLEQDPVAAREAFDTLQHELQAIVTPPKRMTGTRKVGGITLHAEG